MAYNELIKNFEGARQPIRQFLIYGFRSREEFGIKSARTYDDNRRRVQDWLGEYASQRLESGAKAVFLDVDSRHDSRNPIYRAFKAASFTKNDVSLYFAILDMLRSHGTLSIPQMLDIMWSEYLPMFSDAQGFDESTLRKKLKEYVGEGIMAVDKRTKVHGYFLPKTALDLNSWTQAIAFFAQESPLGVIGSFLEDRLASPPSFFSFKHRYLHFALDSGVILDLCQAMGEQRAVEIEVTGVKAQAARKVHTLPVKIVTGSQSARQYLAAFSQARGGFAFYRIDRISKVVPKEAVEGYGEIRERFDRFRSRVWGVSVRKDGYRRGCEQVQMTLAIKPNEAYVLARLAREKRSGTVEMLSEGVYRYSCEVYEPNEMLPWIRTFSGRILSLVSSDKTLEERFAGDLALICGMYGIGGKDAVAGKT